MSSKTLSSLKGPILAEPDFARVPVQSPLAAQAVASVVAHLRLTDLPCSTEVGVAVNDVIAATGTTLTVTFLVTVPARPLQASV